MLTPLVLTLQAAQLSLVALAAPPPQTELNFEASGLHGGGGTTCVAWDPHAIDRVIVSGDVSGIHISENAGTNWKPGNGGLKGHEQMSIASVKFSPTMPNVVWMASGKRGEGGGVFVSLNGGSQWHLVGDHIGFSGKRNTSTIDLPVDLAIPPGTDLPRSVGHLLCLDEDRNLIYAGSFNNGIYVGRYDLMNPSGPIVTWAPEPIALMPDSIAWGSEPGIYPYHIRTMAISYDGLQLLAGTLRRGLHMVELSFAGGGTFPTVMLSERVDPDPSAGVTGPGDLDTVEEIVLADGHVYIAAGSSGIASWDGVLGNDPDLLLKREVGDPWWCSIEARRKGGTTQIWAGCTQPVDYSTMPWADVDDGGDPMFDNVVFTTNSGMTWKSAVLDDCASWKPEGSSNDWWRADSQTTLSGFNIPASNARNAISRSSFRATALAHNPVNDYMVVAGNSCVYRAIAAAGAASSWELIVNDLQLTVATTIGVSPTGEVWMGVMDWGGVSSANGTDDVLSWDRMAANSRAVHAYAFDPDHPE